MKYRKVQLNSQDKNLKHLLVQIAKWHNDTPKIWIPDYEPTDEELEQTMGSIRSTKDEDLFLTIVEDEKGQAQGFIWAYRMEETSDCVMIKSLYVTEEFRGHGIATKLKGLLEEWCRDIGVKTIKTTTHYNNKNMLALNIKLGYVPGMVHMCKNLV
ncbi:GNAT family N-acetyltransferase [Lutispora thermophila]|uniref:Acetyltransferase (GNAT) domain-containing protein n=1 Tax=Lutispora thermophila DSM 19022 TaxID=1122184 RepID=A0A1M6CM29_9FIRM|nr:GNAT family N-acetyltransferase [Lutispora thermophila]SHI61768.1 Acetyltransferase (GNAT) domain-containing protein [Lutispora thermophila DSM 19022]